MKKTNNTSLLITGGCGFIGSSIIGKLLRNYPGINIRVLDNFTSGTPDDLEQITTFKMTSAKECVGNSGVTLIEADIRDADSAINCSEGVDCIVHLAANTGVASSVENPRLDMECNILGTLNMLEAARLNSVRKFIFASSGAPAGEVEPPVHEELPPHPVSPYGASKLAGEGYCSAYYHTFGIDTVCLRFGNVYGPRSRKKSSVVARFIRQALSGETCVIYGDGNQTRDFLYIDDLVTAVLISMEKDVGGETFQIATSLERTVSEIAYMINQELSKLNISMNISHDQPRLGDVKRNFADTTKAKDMLGWHCRMPLEKGIEYTVNYFLNLMKNHPSKRKNND